MKYLKLPPNIKTDDMGFNGGIEKTQICFKSQVASFVKIAVGIFCPN